MSSDFIFISESVTRGHPDKMCDQISDAIVDAYLTGDHHSSVIAECAAAKGIIFLAVRCQSDALVDLPSVSREIIADAGYRSSSFNARDCTFMTTMTEAPARVEAEDENRLDASGISAIKARQHVTLFGYACNQTPTLMPVPVWLAHQLVRKMDAVREKDRKSFLSPDGQSQVAVEYRDRRPVNITEISLVTGMDHDHAVEDKMLEDFLQEEVITPILSDCEFRDGKAPRIIINPGGLPSSGGPMSHAGLTGRKTGSDTYGEFSRHSGSALSGKDPTRIDRIGAYVARYAAKNIVTAGLADECEVQLSYGIGRAEPLSLEIDTFGSAKIPEEEIEKRLLAHVDFRPAAIVARFDLRRLPALHDGRFYVKLARYGHMGREDLEVPWEQTDLANSLR
ncbi:methionine adenosyltransferase [Emcibacter nanhaiensis]|uniref:Methionine adenosyltransferase n=1 Tax=Emcibacter nanhaiensis TaxID=1505037 RepID=A0A501PEM0_9PROT|nr:methionine adenosyltransferase [Emcibacter nanhaiensis]TPD58889.1 methionine adenosyltransferase [Emcibacter nanhaiensis]